jgi:hypothetical protein
VRHPLDQARPDRAGTGRGHGARFWRARGTRLGGGEGDHAEDGTENAPGRRHLGEQGDGFGLGEQGFQLGGAAGDLVAERTDQPAATGGQRGGDRMGGGAAGTGRTRRTGGGEAGHQAGETLGGVVEAGPQRDNEEGEAGFAGEAAGDDGHEHGHDEGEPTREVGGEGLDRGREGRGGHGEVCRTKVERGQEGMSAGEWVGLNVGSGGAAIERLAALDRAFFRSGRADAQLRVAVFGGGGPGGACLLIAERRAKAGVEKGAALLLAATRSQRCPTPASVWGA